MRTKYVRALTILHIGILSFRRRNQECAATRAGRPKAVCTIMSRAGVNLSAAGHRAEEEGRLSAGAGTGSSIRRIIRRRLRAVSVASQVAGVDFNNPHQQHTFAGANAKDGVDKVTPYREDRPATQLWASVMLAKYRPLPKLDMIDLDGSVNAGIRIHLAQALECGGRDIGSEGRRHSRQHE